jgi:ATP-dependent Clp protease ATP-binding subunit ClpC
MLPVSERFTERARRAVVLAPEKSGRLDHDHIGTEHLLLGVFREEEGIAARARVALDVALDEVRADVLRVVPRGEVASTGEIPVTPGGKKTLELAPQAVALGHNDIAPSTSPSGVPARTTGS